MKVLKYYHLDCYLTSNQSLDFALLDNAYNFIVKALEEKELGLSKLLPKNIVIQALTKDGQMHIAIPTTSKEYYNFDLYERELHLFDEYPLEEVTTNDAYPVKLQKICDKVFVLVDDKVMAQTNYQDWKKLDLLVIGKLKEVITKLPLETNFQFLQKGIKGNFDFPGLRHFIFKELCIPYIAELNHGDVKVCKSFFENIEKLAQSGDAQAMNHLGLMYYQGIGVKRNEDTALHFFRKAAKEGNADAQENVYLMEATKK